jgi:murein DD-endopeptidase MepM/ murein hydrolase activator NlpD
MRSILAAIIGAMTISVASLTGQPASVFAPIDVQVPVPPRPFVAGGATHLVYELHITNLSARRITLQTIDVMDRSASPDAPPLLHLAGAALNSALRLLGAPPDNAENRMLPGGRTAILFVWATLRPGAVPAALTHQLTVELAVVDTAAGHSDQHSARVTEERAVVVRGIDVVVSTNQPSVIGPPLEGDHWLAANGPGNGPDHRRTLLAVTGEGRIAQRFAIDWVRLFEEGRTFKGDPRNNASYRAFGAKVLAVADGIVRDTLDGLPENVPDPVARAVLITPTTVSGNYILVDVGDEAYAVYAHLQPGSLRVKKGDHVHRGQVLALVGNTGNSSEPHLHFHMADRPRAIDAEGIPYAFAAFALEAEPEVVTPAMRVVGDSLEIGPSGLASWKAVSPRRREQEIPLLNTIVTFLER